MKSAKIAVRDQKLKSLLIINNWFPNKGSSGVFENWVAPKMGGRNRLHKLGIVIFFDQLCKGRLARLDLQDFGQVQIDNLRLIRPELTTKKEFGK